MLGVEQLSYLYGDDEDLYRELWIRCAAWVMHVQRSAGNRCEI